MAGIATYAQQQMLNWMLGMTTTPTRPTGPLAVNLSLGAPSSTSASEVATGSGITRQALTQAAWAAGTMTNSAAMTFGPVSSGCTVSGISIWDTGAGGNTGIGNYLWYGLLSTVRTLGVGDSLQIPTGGLTITLS